LLDQGYTLDSVDRWDHTQDPKHAIAKQDAPGGSKGDESLAAKATDPTAMLTQVQIQNVFVPKSIKADGYANQFIIQPVIPVVQRSWMPSRMVVRPTVPILTTPETGGSGIGDSTVLAPFVWDTEDKSATYGIGPAVILPTATDDRTGEGQWQGGPAAVYIYKGIKGIQVGGVVYNVWDMWGDNDRKAINKLYAQAILNVHWGEGWYVGLGDFLYSVDWLNGDQVTAPVSVKLGKVVQIGKSKYNIFIAPFYTAEHGDAGPLWGIKLNITLLLPGVHL